MRSTVLALFGFTTLVLGIDDFPLVPGDVAVTLYAKEPLVRNPCAIAFDAKGRLSVGMGPQYRSPKPDTPGDSVWILIDADQDGQAESRVQFATGFNAIQSLAWKEDALWVANAPDLTVVRDLDGDDEADEYVRLYTDLGNLEHGLHGLNWGPDGKLYMSKGNSKGLNRGPDRIAPKPFRDLWGMVGPVGAPDLPMPVTFDKTNYQKNYHDPSDDWGLCGGVLRCDADGRNLEIVSRGNRNPWDISFDDGFDWLGTDNDQNHGDKFFAPFYGAHFGWGHPWSFEWQHADDHLPSAPSAGPLFEGSGTGVLSLGLDRYPEKYRGVFLVNDWLKRQVYIYRPKWNGAWLEPETAAFALFADAGRGRSMDRSHGRRFDPVDLELGPDGAVYIASWGREYGAKIEQGEMANEGRIYRLWPKEAPPQSWPTERDPWRDLDSHLPVWRANAQETLVKQGADVVDRLKSIVSDNHTRKNFQTWAAWTLGRITPDDESLDAWLSSRANEAALNLKLQVLRILAFRAQKRGQSYLPDRVRELLGDPEARVRHETVLAMRQASETRWNDALLKLMATELDRVVYYSSWGALSDLMSVTDRKALLDDRREPVRLAALLSLLEEDALDERSLVRMTQDPSQRIAELASKRLGGKAEGIIKGPALVAVDATESDQERRPLSLVSAIAAESGNAYREASLVPGGLAYTDRKYRFLEIPKELIGETFIRGANDDADADQGTSLTLTLRYPSTVYLVDDQRGGDLPQWARGRFEATDMRLRTTDADMKVYQTDLPAGEVVFGPNREGLSARKSLYMVVVRPKLIDGNNHEHTVEDILSLLPKAEAERGRTLVLSNHGATCFLCHQLEGIGNVFAPDLSDIGTRADAAFIVKSILDPSAEITEGFAMQAVTTHDGQTIGGIILEETGRALTFGTIGGQEVRVAKSDIATRETAAISAMPPLAGMLTPQQIADITAYLLKPKVPHAGEPLAGKTWGDKKHGWHLTCHDDRLEFLLNGVAVASYYFKHTETKRPFFAHVRTPGGMQVTRNFPPIKGKDPTDHAFMHPGLSLGFAVLGGENFWHNDRGVVVHEDFDGEPVFRQSVVRFAVRNRYLGQDGKMICREHARYALVPNEDGYLISLETTFSSDQAFAFGVKEEMGLALRVASPLRVKDGKGSIVSGKGGQNEEGTWGVVDQWWDYFGPLDDKSVGVQIMSGAGNPEVWAHSRDYGVLVANPFPVDRKENRDKTFLVQPNQPFTLRFGVQVHDSADFDPSSSFRRYLNQEWNP